MNTKQAIKEEIANYDHSIALVVADQNRLHQRYQDNPTDELADRIDSRADYISELSGRKYRLETELNRISTH
ncbi:hypothetical protein [Arthrobacter castelli]|uniref:hypothetical protein n=1 Tax=Arthrobacter castelli TaxID=271431 RepID=UPI000411D3AA|nr:hypothetical protein [Arthrobacter castelli]